MLRDIWNVLSKELNEQRQFLEAEVSNMRQQIEAEKEKSAADLIAARLFNRDSTGRIQQEVYFTIRNTS